MALARVVSFDGVTKDRIEEMQREIGEGEPPEGLPAKESSCSTIPTARNRS